MYANMTMSTANNELVISMERFKTLLKNVECGEKSVLAFKNKESFEFAIRAWNWVNEDETHSFILIADYAGCGPDEERVPYYIHNADYDEENFTAYLYGKEIPWDQAAHTFDLDYGTATLVQASSSSTITRRFGPDIKYNKDVTMGLNAGLNGNIFTAGTPSSDFYVKLDCTDCGLKGALVVAGRISVDLTDVKELSISLEPRDVSASLTLAMRAKGKLKKPLQYAPTLAELPIPGAGFKIPGVATLGLVVKANFGVGLKNWEGDATMTYGVTAAISNSATVKMDLANDGDAVQFSGWQPTFKQKPFGITAKAAVDASVFNAVAIAAKIEVVKKGFELALELKSPELLTHLASVSNKNGVCGTKKTIGVNVNADFKASVNLKGSAKLKREAQDNPLTRRQEGSIVEKRLKAAFSKTLWVRIILLRRLIMLIDINRRAQYLGTVGNA